MAGRVPSARAAGEHALPSSRAADAAVVAVAALGTPLDAKSPFDGVEVGLGGEPLQRSSRRRYKDRGTWPAAATAQSESQEGRERWLSRKKGKPWSKSCNLWSGWLTRLVEPGRFMIKAAPVPVDCIGEAPSESLREPETCSAE